MFAPIRKHFQSSFVISTPVNIYANIRKSRNNLHGGPV